MKEAAMSFSMGNRRLVLAIHWAETAEAPLEISVKHLRQLGSASPQENSAADHALPPTAAAFDLTLPAPYRNTPCD
jgi:hypothetical protein